MIQKSLLSYTIYFIIVFITLYTLYYLFNKQVKCSISEGFASGPSFTLEQNYKKQLATLNSTIEPYSSAKRPVTELLNSNIMPEEEQCLVNFNVLGCRFTGYLGPFEEGYFDPDNAVRLAVAAGCRCFVLEIDYIDGEGSKKYFPRIAIRDKHNRLRMKHNTVKPSDKEALNKAINSIEEVCRNINFYAFNAAQNSTDPVIIVLYFLRTPPGGYNSKAVLDYYSNVAKALAPLQDRLVHNLLQGGNFYRQQQEGKLLINNITDYNNKVLIFSNANTNGFRQNKTYKSSEDLDYLVNLRLNYIQSKLGVTEDMSNGSTYGILDTAENYTIIPSDRIETVADETKLRWTICLSQDPSKPVNKKIYNTITSQLGIHCAPIQIFDKDNTFMFTDKTFKTYSYIPKPEPLRYIKPPIVIPGEPNPSTDAKQGMLRSPTI
jgi:hypothetical protein